VNSRLDTRPLSGRGLLRVVPLAAVLAVFASGVFASPAAASIAFVQDLGQVAATGTSATISTTGLVTTGNSIIVFVATNNGATTITCSDPVNGAYTTDVQVTTSDVRSAICSTHNVQCMPSSTSVTINSSNSSNIAARVAEFTGLAATHPLGRPGRMPVVSS
jgi:hypothetical protein